MQFEPLLILLLIGATAGYLASMLIRGFGFSTIGNVAVGIAGAFVASWLLPQFDLFAGSQIVSAIVGAVVLLIVIEFVRKIA
jgi:uncharacterized membrane protein YeaQ/YmgE (transglycosylase-associated protein family)